MNRTIVNSVIKKEYSYLSMSYNYEQKYFDSIGVISTQLFEVPPTNALHLVLSRSPQFLIKPDFF